MPRHSHAHRLEQPQVAPRDTRALFIWFVLNILLLLPRQVTWQGLWWNLARGREAFLGSTQPSADLLLAARQPEADWLSGVPGFGLFLAGETTALATAIPLLLALIAWLAARSALRSAALSLDALLSVPLLLLAIRDGISSQPLLLTAGLLLFTQRIGLRNLHTRSAAVLSGICLGTLWANLAPGAPWGILILLLAPASRLMPPPEATQPRRHPNLNSSLASDEIQFSRTFAAISFTLGTLITPAGYIGLIQQIQFCLADLSASWRLSQILLTADDIAFSHRSPTFQLLLLITLMVVTYRLQHATATEAATLPAPVWKSSCWSLLPLVMFLCNQRFLGPAAISCIGSLPQLTTEPAPYHHGNFGRKLLPIWLLLTIGLLLDAGGFTPWNRQAWGWGLAQELDLRLLNLPAAPAGNPPAPVFSSDQRTTGVAAWLTPQLQPIDHPEAAFREGRLQSWLRILIDLREDHRAVYQLADGTTGGWYQKLQQWNTQYLLLPVEQQELIAAVQRMDWNIIDLDSPNVPFAVGSDSLHQQAITMTAAEQDFVQFGPWLPDAEVYSGHGERFSVSLPNGHSAVAAAAIRQARIFRCLALETAAIRSLAPVRPASSRPLKAELLLAQQDLAWMEWTNFGQPCRFRLQILALGKGSGLPAADFPWDAPSPSKLPADEQIHDAASRYLQGTGSEARLILESLQDPQPEVDYAIATLLLEEGQSAAASAKFAELLRSDSPLHLQRAALWWKTRIDSYLPEANSPGADQ